MQIFVTQSDINRALARQRGNEPAVDPATYCPIWQSVKRRFPNALTATVGAAYIRVWQEDGTEIRARICKRARSFMRHFDKRLPVRPSRFQAEFEPCKSS